MDARGTCPGHVSITAPGAILALVGAVHHAEPRRAALGAVVAPSTAAAAAVCAALTAGAVRSACLELGEHRLTVAGLGAGRVLAVSAAVVPLVGGDPATRGPRLARATAELASIAVLQRRLGVAAAVIGETHAGIARPGDRAVVRAGAAAGAVVATAEPLGAVAEVVIAGLERGTVHAAVTVVPAVGRLTRAVDARPVLDPHTGIGRRDGAGDAVDRTRPEGQLRRVDPDVLVVRHHVLPLRLGEGAGDGPLLIGERRPQVEPVDDGRVDVRERHPVGASATLGGSVAGHDDAGHVEGRPVALGVGVEIGRVGVHASLVELRRAAGRERLDVLAHDHGLVVHDLEVHVDVPGAVVGDAVGDDDVGAPGVLPPDLTELLCKRVALDLGQRQRPDVVVAASDSAAHVEDLPVAGDADAVRRRLERAALGVHRHPVRRHRSLHPELGQPTSKQAGQAVVQRAVVIVAEVAEGEGASGVVQQGQRAVVDVPDRVEGLLGEADPGDDLLLCDPGVDEPVDEQVLAELILDHEPDLGHRQRVLRDLNHGLPGVRVPRHVGRYAHDDGAHRLPLHHGADALRRGDGDGVLLRRQGA